MERVAKSERDLVYDRYSSLTNSIVWVLCGVCGSETQRVSSPVQSAGISSQAGSQSLSQSQCNTARQ